MWLRLKLNNLKSCDYLKCQRNRLVHTSKMLNELNENGKLYFFNKVIVKNQAILKIFRKFILL